ncbi:MAG: hypothetical protein ACTS45_00935 [Candidatus Hodgkinia cicadicola]
MDDCGCSPFKAVRELGSERRETVRSLSAAGARVPTGPPSSTRGPRGPNRWCSCCPRRHGRVATFGKR